MSGNVCFEKQKTRDNSMYYLSESCNLRASDNHYNHKDVFNKPIVQQSRFRAPAKSQEPTLLLNSWATTLELVTKTAMEA